MSFSVACAMTLALAACGNGSRTSSGGQNAVGTSGSNDASGETMTLTGCVQAGDPAGTYVLVANDSRNETSGTRGTSGSEPGNATGTGGSASSGSQTGQSGADTSRHDRAPMASGGTESPRTYRLIPTGNIDFGQNEGKEVTVTGKIATEAQGDKTVGTSGSSGAGQGDAGRPLAGAKGSGANRAQGNLTNQSIGGQFFRVASLQKIADSCSAGSAEKGRRKR